MRLKFIGINGSMGLIHGKIYNVKIISDDKYIWVKWSGGQCPYISPQTLATNWKLYCMGD